MGRRWIMVELGENCHTHIIPRLKKVIDATNPGGITEAAGWKGGGVMRRRTRHLSKPPPIYERIRHILESARTNVARSVNTMQVVANWLIGREIVEEEQKGVPKAGYGDQLLAEVSARLVEEYGRGYSGTNLRWFRQLYLCYPDLVPPSIRHPVRDKLQLKAA